VSRPAFGTSDRTPRGSLTASQGKVESMVDSPGIASIDLSLQPAGAREARRFLVRQLTPQVPTETVEVATLCTSELVTNALRHAGDGGVRLTVDQDGHRLRVEVEDGAAHALPVRGHARPGDTSGRGLAIVEALGADWGVDAGSATKTVWFELPVQGFPTA
jgi:anti-sigma regulatory factor (Ser/Thr protein kinase)